MHGHPLHRFCCRLLTTLGRSWFKASSGWEQVLAANDPFILAPNHSSRLEALLLPAMLAWQRRGRQVHFVADWNFLLLPVIGSVMRMNDPIVVTRKPARPRFLNVFKPWFKPALTPFKEARERLLAGQSLGIFPEGTVNPNRQDLLRGQSGVARLSLETGAAVIPVGLSFSGQSGRWLNMESMIVRLGRPLKPVTDYIGSTAPAEVVAQWHQRTMMAIADLSGKNWHPNNPKNKYAPAYSSITN
jgi:1-acyl-sn-glycerol-3-phosphate acyltransferase